MDLMEDNMSWYEPKVMSDEMSSMLRELRAHPKLAKPVS